jgi:hypothetical protein
MLYVDTQESNVCLQDDINKLGERSIQQIKVNIVVKSYSREGVTYKLKDKVKGDFPSYMTRGLR